MPLTKQANHLQGMPIKTIHWEKFIISLIAADFFTKFTVFTEDSGHICRANIITIFGLISK